MLLSCLFIFIILFLEQLDEIDVAANLFLFIIGGHETTAATLSFCLYELSVNPELQEKVREEVLQVRNKRGNAADSLKELVYMDSVIKGRKKQNSRLKIGTKFFGIRTI